MSRPPRLIVALAVLLTVVGANLFTSRASWGQDMNEDDRNRELVKARGTTVGLPDLVAGRRIQIGGVGARMSGTYFVTSTTHTINDSGYFTTFNARREDRGEGGPP